MSSPSELRSVGTASRARRRWARWLGVGVPSFAVLAYSLVVIWFVATSGDTGLRCVFGPRVKELTASNWSPEIRLDIAADLKGKDAPTRWSPGPPTAGREGDRLTMIGGIPINNYSDVVRSMRHVRDRVGEYAEVRWLSPDGPRYGQVRIERPRWSSYVWSVIWLLQEVVVLAVGARVLLKRPGDRSAAVFFWLCVATVVAFIGGYHWSVIAGEPWLIYPFAGFILFVPILSLHFYLIFPRTNPFFARHRRVLLFLLYLAPTATALGLWVTMSWSRWGEDAQQVDLALDWLRVLALGYIAFSVLIFVVCLACLIESNRRAQTVAQRNQVRWVLLATILSVPPIAWILIDASADPARLGMARTAWPMSIVSLLYTAAYAFSITRYKLMQAERWLNRSVVYVMVSAAAGLVYSAGIVLAALLFGERILGSQASLLGTVVACLTAIVLLELSGRARQRVQKAIEKRFYREKYKFDQAMRKMSLAVGSLVDGATLGRGLLEAAGDVLHSEWGAIYLADAEGGALRLAASMGPEPEEREISDRNPLVARFRKSSLMLKSPHAVSRAGVSDAATDAMIALGGEVATPLESQGALAGLMLLGPKRSGLAYEAEELAFLGALGSVAALALRSADTQRTLESLNSEVRQNVEKIAEQQRRILILQEQLSQQRREAQPERARASAEQAGAAAEADERGKAQDAAFLALKGSSAGLRGVVQMARKVAQSGSAVLLRGESGTGKERLAEAIHRASARAAKPYVKVHCAALSQNLLESELFGHVKGAFTDAKADRVGRFQQADGGTLFLDEIGDINLEVQTKLLRVLQEMAFERVGSSQTIKVDVRVIAATHQDLEALIRAGRFREDLYYRLNVISLRVPSLRERREDVFELAIHFLNESAGRMGKTVTGLGESAIEALVAYDWPGNIRELENAVEHAIVVAEGAQIEVDDLPSELIRGKRGRSRPRPAAVMTAASGRASGEPAWSEPDEAKETWDTEWNVYEQQRLIDALNEAGGNKSRAARLLGMPRSTFFSRLKKYGLA